MHINSLRNFGLTSFGNANPDNTVQIEQPQAKSPAPVNNAQEVELKEPLNEDKFNHAAQSPQAIQSQLTMPSLAQITKMQTTQKLLGGTLFGVGVLGALSFLSPKKWLTAIFTIPVGGIMAYFGANMFSMANALDKLKAIANPPQGQ